MKIKKLNESMLPSRATLDDCLDDYRQNAFGFNGVEDYVDTNYPTHPQEFKAAVCDYLNNHKNESLQEAWQVGDEVTIKWNEPGFEPYAYATCEYQGKTEDGKHKFKSTTYGWDFIVDLENKKIKTPHDKEYDLWDESGWTKNESKSVKEGYRGDDGLDDILGWLQDHKEAWDDFCVDFEDVEDEELTQDMVVDWISGHDQLYDDFLGYFGDDELDESKSINEGNKESRFANNIDLDIINGLNSEIPEQPILGGMVKCSKSAPLNALYYVSQGEEVKFNLGNIELPMKQITHCWVEHNGEVAQTRNNRPNSDLILKVSVDLIPNDIEKSKQLIINEINKINGLNESKSINESGYKLTIEKDGETFTDYCYDYREESAIAQMKAKYGDDINIKGVEEHNKLDALDESKSIDEEWDKEWDNIGIEIEKAAREQHIGVDFINTDSSVMGAFTATFKIDRGDWKHDHWAFDEVVKEYLANNEKYALWKIDTNQIGSSEDDSYSAEHIAFIVPKDKMELLNSMKGLFAESVNPADLTDCPECGDISFDSKTGKCTKCNYRESLNEALDENPIIAWLSEHEQAWEDFTAHFSERDIEDLSDEEIIDWISEHDQLYDDYKKHFKTDDFVEDITNESLIGLELDKDDILDWLAEHEQAWEDAEMHFEDSLEEVSVEDLVGWIADHEQLYDDFQRFFYEDNLDEEFLNFDFNQNPDDDDVDGIIQ